MYEVQKGVEGVVGGFTDIAVALVYDQSRTTVANVKSLSQVATEGMIGYKEHTCVE